MERYATVCANTKRHSSAYADAQADQGLPFSLLLSMDPGTYIMRTTLRGGQLIRVFTVRKAGV